MNWTFLLDGHSISACIPARSSLPGKTATAAPFTTSTMALPTSCRAVIVDYAHAPGAFERLFPWVRKTTSGRITAVFGSRGERDRAKRPMQGEAAARSCDTVVITDEDPRGEDRVKIVEEIAAGCAAKVRGKNLFLIPDRPQAIHRAFELTMPGNVVLLLGKGHEGSSHWPAGAHTLGRGARRLKKRCAPSDTTGRVLAGRTEVEPLKICVLFGGRSGEHEVSLRSAASVVKNLDRTRYEVTAIGIDKSGRWHLQQRIEVREPRRTG